MVLYGEEDDVADAAGIAAVRLARRRRASERMLVGECMIIVL